MLKSRAFDAMTAAGGSFSERSSESKGGNGLGSRESGRLTPSGKTGRNITANDNFTTPALRDLNGYRLLDTAVELAHPF